MKVNPLFDFIRERHAVYERRQRGELKPWTKDPILQQYRFCNVYRELDRVTVWIREQWRDPRADDPELWFAMMVARLLNLPASLFAVGYPVPWDAKRFKRVLRERKEAGEKVFSAAYIIYADAINNGLKTDYLADYVLTPAWRRRKEVKLKDTTLASVHEKLMEFHAIGSFMGGQIIADTKYGTLLRQAEDWETWAAPGPGSQRGLNRVKGYPVDRRWAAEDWLKEVQHLRERLNPKLRKVGMEPMHAQDVQNSLCELDKYERARLGEGRPKQLYPGGGGA